MSKQAMLVWLKLFLHEVDKIDNFFQRKLREFIEEFIAMQQKCLDKTTGMLYVRDTSNFVDSVEAFEID